MVREFSDKNTSNFGFLYEFRGDLPNIDSLEIHKAWKIKILTPQEYKSLAEFEKMTYLAAWGLIAPTTHNTVPEKFKISNSGQITLMLDRNLILPESDKEGRQAIISMGCVMENIIQAASAYGLKTDYQILEDDSSKVLPADRPGITEPVPLVQMTIGGKTTEEIDKKTLNAILKRSVNRSEYSPHDKLPDTLEVKMQDTVREIGDELNLHFITNKALIHAFATFQRQADTAAITRSNFRKELSEWLFANDNISNPRGMRGSEFGLNNDFSIEFTEKLKGVDEMTDIDISGFARGSQNAIESSPAICIISAKSDSIRNRISAGRGYENIALMLQKEGFSTAVHAALTETGYPQIRVISNIVRATILRTNNIPLVVFRAGVPIDKTERKLSAKPPIESVLI